MTAGSIALWFAACGFVYFRGSTNGFFFAAATMPALVGWYCYHFADDFKRKLFSPDFASGMFWAACLGTLGLSTGSGFAESDDATALALLGSGLHSRRLARPKCTSTRGSTARAGASTISLCGGSSASLASLSSSASSQATQ